jgi:AraC family transcriptional regulator, melibiose operon regulatory protein
MSTFITQHRISHAQRLLVTTDDRIVSIAVEAGFQSISRVNEAFKTACGRSPRQYRGQIVGRIMQTTDPPKVDANTETR